METRRRLPPHSSKTGIKSHRHQELGYRINQTFQQILQTETRPSCRVRTQGYLESKAWCPNASLQNRNLCRDGRDRARSPLRKLANLSWCKLAGSCLERRSIEHYSIRPSVLDAPVRRAGCTITIRAMSSTASTNRRMSRESEDSPEIAETFCRHKDGVRFVRSRNVR